MTHLELVKQQAEQSREVSEFREWDEGTFTFFPTLEHVNWRFATTLLHCYYNDERLGHKIVCMHARVLCGHYTDMKQRLHVNNSAGENSYAKF